MLKDSENVRVIVRVRPLTEREEVKGDDELVSCFGDRSVQVIESSPDGRRPATGTQYQFNQCFGAECSQQQLFEGCGVLPLLDHVLDGYSATVFAYGPTGSGKTYTITGRPDNILRFGSGDESDGIVIRSVEALFDKIQAKQRDGLQFKVRTSCVEIYNENVLDLFKYNRSAGGKNYLPVKFDTKRASFFVGDLSYGKCNSVEDLLRLYMKGLRNRSVASHELNRDSSRSHCLLTVYVDSMVASEDGQIITRHGKITFVDLAGSERLKDSQSQGSTLRETGSINKSIFTLGKVISSLCDRKKMKIPYRDSKLTQLLMDSIGGTSMTIMLACVSPASSHLNETIRTLKYASSAKNIKNKPVVLLDPHQTMVSELKKEIDQLRAENKALRDALMMNQSMQGSLSFQQDGSRSSSAPDSQQSHQPQYPSENLRHSTGDLRQPEYSQQRGSSNSMLYLSSPKAHDDQGRRSDNGPERASFHGHGRGDRGGHAQRPHGPMPTVKHRPSPEKTKNKSLIRDYGKVPSKDPLAHRRNELQTIHFRMPQIQVSGRSVQEIHADERAIMRDMESAATFSYFNQRPDAETSPTSYHKAIRASGGYDILAQDEREQKRNRMKTAERNLREEILQLPEAQEYFPHHQRRVLQPGERPRSKSAMGGKIGQGKAGFKTKQNPSGSERAGVRELEKLSKYSYFRDESVSTNEKPHLQTSSFNLSPGKGYSGKSAYPADRRSLYAGDEMGDASHNQGSFAHHSLTGGSVPSYMHQTGSGVGSNWKVDASERDQEGHHASRMYGSGVTSSINDRDQRDRRNVTSPRSIRDQPTAGSPKSIRSSASAADGIYKTIASSGHHRPSSAERDALLDDALDEMMNGGGGGNGRNRGVARLHEKTGHADDEWMTKLNPLSGLDLNNVAAGNWQQELARAGKDTLTCIADSRGSSGCNRGIDHGGSAGTEFASGSVATRSERPRSANRPPTVPRNYLQPQAPVDVTLVGEKERNARHGADSASLHTGSYNQAFGATKTSASEGGTSSYEELMRNLEQSRLKAQQARISILEKRQQWMGQ